MFLYFTFISVNSIVNFGRKTVHFSFVRFNENDMFCEGNRLVKRCIWSFG